ncbi:response regulator [candidate division TA06 bacterium]|nr:response regulator [candidate division TA06 bacterium]
MAKQKRTILIVDDDTDMSWLLQNLLGGLDCDFQIAFTGEEALSFLKTKTPDLIFLDIKLPDMSGMRVLEEVRGRNRKSPVVIITSFGTEELRREVTQWDVYRFVDKPFEVERIQSIAREALTVSKKIIRSKGGSSKNK